MGTGKTVKADQPQGRRLVDVSISSWAESFVLDRSVHCAERTVEFYQHKLARFQEFCQEEGIQEVEDIRSDDIRRYIAWLEARGHNPGGRHAHFRVLRTFLRWYDNEMDPEWNRNPIDRVQAPKVPRMCCPPSMTRPSSSF
jgi:site-specific recombinase XerD